jgi:protein involved in polysaccharide export with SLBB domain
VGMSFKHFFPISITAALLFILGCTVPSKNVGGSALNVTKADTNSTCNEKFVPGDGVRIRLPLDSASFLAGIYAIDKNGFINLPIIGKYKVVSVSPVEFSAYIQKSYEQYLRYPEVQITPLIRISLLGGFVRPGLYYVDPQNSLWDLISLAGGTTHERGLSKIRWERDRRQINSGDLVVAFEKGRSLEEIGFQSGDQIVTPNDPLGLWDIILRDVLPAGTFGLSLYMLFSGRHY